MNVQKNAHFAVSGEETINFIDSGDKAVRWPWVEIETDSEVTVKLSEDTPEENTWIVKSHAVIPCGVSTIYISGSANVQIVGLTSPGEAAFKSGGKGGESWVNATGNPVTLKNLQGGVPFNSVEVSGKNLHPAFSFTEKHTTGTNAVNSTINANGTVTFSTADTFQTNQNPVNSSEASRIDLTLYSGKKITVSVTWFSGTIKGKSTGAPIWVQYSFKDAAGQTIGVAKYPSVSNCSVGGTYKFVTFDVDEWLAQGAATFTVNYWIGGGHYSSDVTYGIQVEIGEAATAYEPPIVGKEMALNVSGKNHVNYPYATSNITTNDVTFMSFQDGGIYLNGTASANTYFAINSRATLAEYGLKIGDTVFCSADNKKTSGGVHFYFCDAGNHVVHDVYTQNEFAPYTIPDNVTNLYIGFYCGSGVKYAGLFYPQIEIGDKYTAYELPKGVTSYTITPDTNPYTVPMDITQVDGTNVITADNDAVISVNANRKNPQLAKIYAKIDELTTAMIVGLGGID